MRVIGKMAWTVLALWLASWPASAAVTRFAPEFIAMGNNEFGLAIGYRLRTSTPNNGDHISVAPLTAAFPPDSDRFVTASEQLEAVDTRRPRIKASTGVWGRAEFGKLAGSATALAEYELARAEGTVILEFMDMLTIDTAAGTGLNFDFLLTGSVEQDIIPQQTQTPSFARSDGKAELFIWPCCRVPRPGELWDFTYYATSHVTPENGRTYFALGSLDFTPGALYWMVGRLEVNAVASTNGLADVLPPHRVFATGDFSHTFNVYIDPAPGTDGVGYRVASGFDYRTPTPVPLPSTGWLAGALLALVPSVARRSGKRRPGCSRSGPG